MSVVDADVTDGLAKVGSGPGVHGAGFGHGAKAAWEALAHGKGAESITQQQVQQFLWYDLPLQWQSQVEEHLPAHLTQVAAQLFDDLGLDRYAAICRSRTTAEVLAAFQRSDEQGLKAFREAVKDSGIEPPDSKTFRWGAAMATDVETAAQRLVSAVLELAITTGFLMESPLGWRASRRALTAAVLDNPHPDLPGQTWRSAIDTERLRVWVSLCGRSPRLSAMRARQADLLVGPVPPPDESGERQAPLLWLLERADAQRGLPIARTGAFGPELVDAAASRWGWRKASPTGPPDGSDTPELDRLQEIARRCGALRQHKGELLITPTGKRMAADPTEAWQAVTPWLGGIDSFDQMTAEIAALVLLNSPHQPLAPNQLWADVATIARDHGWRVCHRYREPPRQSHVTAAAQPWLTTGRLFGLLTEQGDARTGRIQLTAAGTAAMLAYLRARATTPRSPLRA